MEVSLSTTTYVPTHLQTDHIQMYGVGSDALGISRKPTCVAPARPLYFPWVGALPFAVLGRSIRLPACLYLRAASWRPVFFCAVQLLYLDESGTTTDPNQRYFVLGGVAMFERVTHWVEQDLENIAARFDPNEPRAIELHGSPMRGGRGVWRSFKVEKRLDAMKDALRVIARRHPKDLRLFGAVVRRQALAGKDPIEHAFEQVTSRFDLYLRRLHLNGDTQRGLMLFDKSSTEQRLQTLAREFKYVGHQWGTTMNYAEVPVFLDSKASRLIQLADLVAFALFRRYEHGDGTFFDIIRNCFDSEGGVVHGLYEKL
jgi:Protein of unknown function (DUF3800)